MAKPPTGSSPAGPKTAGSSAQLTAHATVNMAGPMWSLTQSELIALGCFGVVIIACITATTLSQHWLPSFVGVGCMVMMAGIIGNRLLRSWRITELPAPTEMSGNLSDGTFAITTYLPEPSAALLQLRELYLGRDRIPIPNGDVLNGDPGDVRNLREYSPQEQAQIASAIPQDVIESDIRALKLALSKIQGALPPPQHGSSAEQPPNDMDAMALNANFGDTRLAASGESERRDEETLR